MNNQNKILSAHQRFMEDKEKRANDLIVLSLPEKGEHDDEEFRKVLRAIDVNPEDINVTKFTRLGKNEEGNARRNLL